MCILLRLLMHGNKVCKSSHAFLRTDLSGIQSLTVTLKLLELINKKEKFIFYCKNERKQIRQTVIMATCNIYIIKRMKTICQC
jgi:hypothetical protein